MQPSLEQSFLQWDRQVNEPHSCYIRLNNVYLWVQKGYVPLEKCIASHLRSLVSLAYEPTDDMRDWWMNEFTKLPGWFDV